jgi:hypothetical protein
MQLNTEPNIDKPDDFYEVLINSQRDLDESQVRFMNAKLVLLLANHIGDLAVIRDALVAAQPKTKN